MTLALVGGSLAPTPTPRRWGVCLGLRRCSWKQRLPLEPCPTLAPSPLPPAGKYLAEFSISYKPTLHGRPGLGATHSSRFIPLK